MTENPTTEETLRVLLDQVYTYFCYAQSGVPSTNAEQTARFNELFPAFSRFYLDGGVLTFPPLVSLVALDGMEAPTPPSARRRYPHPKGPNT